MIKNEPRKIATNLYKDDESGKYFRLFATGCTPNFCWLVCPEYRELVDIDVATGKDIYGDAFYIVPDTVGTVSAYNQYIAF